MIFVTIGNGTQNFRRLLRAVDDLAGNGFFNDEKVFIQTGNNPEFIPNHCEYTPFLSMEEFEHLMEDANLIICHGGCGTLLHSMRLGKLPVVMPRRKKYDEIVNDHQLQLVQALAAEGKVIPAYEPTELKDAIDTARLRNAQPLTLSAPPLLSMISQAIDELINR